MIEKNHPLSIPLPAEDDPNTNPEDGFRRKETGGGVDDAGDEPTYEEVKE